MTALDTSLSDLSDKLAALNKIRGELAEMRAGDVAPTDPTYQAKTRADMVAEDALIQARAAVLIEVAAQAAQVVRSHGYVANKAAQVLQSLVASAETDGRLFAVADVARQHIATLDRAVDLTDADAQRISNATRNFVMSGGFENMSAELYDAIEVTPTAPVAEPATEQVAA